MTVSAKDTGNVSHQLVWSATLMKVSRFLRAPRRYLGCHSRFRHNLDYDLAIEIPLPGAIRP